MFLHYLFNILGNYSNLFGDGIPSPTVAEDINILSAAIQLVIMLPCIPIAYRIYKKAGKKNLQNYNNPDF